MATVKDLLKLATTAAVGTLACQGGAQARRASGSLPANDHRSSPLDSLDPTASPADYHDYSDAPAPALPYFNSTGNSTADVPCFDNYNNRVLESVDNLYETLSLLDNVTICEPYIN